MAISDNLLCSQPAWWLLRLLASQQRFVTQDSPCADVSIMLLHLLISNSGLALTILSLSFCHRTLTTTSTSPRSFVRAIRRILRGLRILWQERTQAAVSMSTIVTAPEAVAAGTTAVDTSGSEIPARVPAKPSAFGLGCTLKAGRRKHMQLQ